MKLCYQLTFILLAVQYGESTSTSSKAAPARGRISILRSHYDIKSIRQAFSTHHDPPAPVLDKGKERMKEPKLLQLMPGAADYIKEHPQDIQSKEQIEKDWLSLAPSQPSSTLTRDVAGPMDVARLHGPSETTHPTKSQANRSPYFAVKEQFYKQIGPHLDAAGVAKGVRSFRVQGISPSLEATTTPNKHNYAIGYSNAYTELSNRFPYSKGRISAELNEVPLSAYGNKDSAMTVSKNDLRQPLKRKHYSKKQKEIVYRTNEKMQRIGQQFENHFIAKNKDISHMSVKDIEEQSRHLGIPDVGRPLYGKLLNRFLLEYKKSVMDVEAFRHLRERSVRHNGGSSRDRFERRRKS
jgi:hypothetical protein